MPLDTYSGLKQAIADHLDRNDLADHLDTFIDLVEARHAREVRIREMMTFATVQLDEDARTISLPAGALDVANLRVVNAPSIVTPLQVNFDELNRHWRNRNGLPSVYALRGSVVEFDRLADRDYDVEIAYYARLTPLSAAAPVNALLTRAPDAYLYGALVAAEPFLAHDERIGTWEQGYSNAVAALALTDRRARHIGPLVSRVRGMTP